MELELSKSFLIQRWEFIVLFIAVVYFLAKLQNKRNIHISKAAAHKVKSDDEVIAGDFKSDELNDEDDLTPSLEDIDYVPYKGARVSLKGGAQEFLEMMNDRRSVRMFSNKPVDIEIVRKCIQAAGTSPSGAHTEPWTFCLVKELVKHLKDFLSEMCEIFLSLVRKSKSKFAR